MHTNKHIEIANERLAKLYGAKHRPITETEIEAMYGRDVLSVAADAKTSKGGARGYLTGILYLSPSNLFTSVNLCPFASYACRSACLFSAGRGRFYSVTRARVVRTIAFLSDSARFIITIRNSVAKLKRRAERTGMKPVVRLNGTSDIDWGKFNLGSDVEHVSIFEFFRDIQFYDYTKRPRAAETNKHANYHITFSDSGENLAQVDRQPDAINIATVFRGKLPPMWRGRIVINGDESDLRFLDPRGVVVGLLAKGAARKQDSNFVN